MNDHWVFRREKTLETANGYLIRIKMKLKKLPEPYGQEFPNGYKFGWIAYNVKNDGERVLFDNHTNKPPHIHTNGHEEYFEWVSLSKSEKLFLIRVQQRFGYFEIELDKT